MIGSHLTPFLAGESTPTAKIEDLLDAAVAFARDMVGALRCSLMVPDGPSKELIVRKAHGLDRLIADYARVKLGEGVAGWVALHRQSVLAQGPDAYPHIARRHPASYGTPSFVSVPVSCPNETVGVLNVADKRDGGVFTSADLLALERLASFMATLLALQSAVDGLSEMSYVDSLTGLVTPRYFEQRLAQELARARRYGRALTLLLLDVANFDLVEDRCGRKVADQVLGTLAAVVRQQFRQSDVVARYDGDKFAIILPETGPEVAELVAERLIAATGQSPAAIIPLPDSLALCAGISSYPDLAVDEEQLIQQTQSAHSKAKTHSTRRVQLWRSPAERFLEAQRLGIPSLLAPAEMITPEVARFIPIDFARRHCCVPVGYERGKLTVAVLDPTDTALLQTLAGVTHLAIHPVISSHMEITSALSRMSELWRKPAAADIVIRRTPRRGRELTILVKPLAKDADVDRIVQRVVDACHAPGTRILSAEAPVLVVHATTSGCSRLLKALRQIDDLLVESVRVESNHARRGGADDR